MLPTYEDATTRKYIGYTDNFLANAILANPKLGLKSFKDYAAGGMGYEDALKALGAHERQVARRSPFEEYVNKTSGTGFKLEVVDDAKSLVLAKAGREDFVNPEGAPIVYTLRQEGWTDLIDIGDLIKYGPGGVDSPIEPLIGGGGANANYVNKNPNAVLHFMSVVWRIIAETKKDPSLFDIQAPYLNSFAGTSLDGKGVEATVNILDPCTPFEEDAQYYDDAEATMNCKNVWSAIIKDFAAHKIMTEGK